MKTIRKRQYSFQALDTGLTRDKLAVMVNNGCLGDVTDACI